MRTWLLPSICFATAIAFGAPITLGAAYAQEAERLDDAARQKEGYQSAVETGRLEGLWDVTVELINCETGGPIRTLRAMNMFSRGGTMTETPGAPFTTRGVGLGVWQHQRGRRYDAAFRFFRFNADGSPAGSTRFVAEINLRRDGTRFTAAAISETFDAAGDLVQTGCATEIGTRLE